MATLRSPSDGPKSLLTAAWRAGYFGRSTVVVGLIVNAVWAVFISVVTVRFIGRTLSEPGLAWVYRAAAVTFVPIFALVIVVSVPATWLMYVLVSIDRRQGQTDQQPK